MGRSDTILYSPSGLFANVKPTGNTALLGFPSNNKFDGDCYDIQLGNWEINSEWNLRKKYDTIICLRVAYFAKDPEDFIKRCHDHLNEGGKLYVDWGLGDHWRFDDYKIGWVKDGEQEYAYKEDNFLWSTIWDDSFLKNDQFKKFEEAVKKYDYYETKEAIFKEVPKILDLKFVEKYYKIEYKILALWTNPSVIRPQLYILLECEKNTSKNC
tara:strand:+ start:2018 stop:2653 length:636 start_codon:yes stop_codon:yes gene_type:complete